jgi:hypothetical protein
MSGEQYYLPLRLTESGGVKWAEVCAPHANTGYFRVGKV